MIKQLWGGPYDGQHITFIDKAHTNERIVLGESTYILCWFYTEKRQFFECVYEADKDFQIKEIIRKEKA